MRYYAINSDGKELVIDIDKGFQNVSQNMWTFDVVENFKGKVDKNKKYFVKKLAGRQYISEDGISWNYLAKLNSMKPLVNLNESFQVYRGFKPSGLNSASAGELVTDMPGKVVKVMTEVGSSVVAGDTLLILEAMKMENEIKAGVSGTVKAVHVEAGQNLESGHLMIEIEE